MRKIRLAVCIEDPEYSERFGRFLMNHYPDRIELYVYTRPEILLQKDLSGPDAVLMSGFSEMRNPVGKELPGTLLFYLADSAEERASMNNEDTEWKIMEKYQDVNGIVDAVLQGIGQEVREICAYGRKKCSLTGVYALSGTELQLPFAVTSAAVMGEKEKVLLLDLQENSGLTVLAGERPELGLEEILVMAESRRFSAAQLGKSIGHLDKLDFIYPALCSENLCEPSEGTYRELVKWLCEEAGYDRIVISFGCRFRGFMELMALCDRVFLLRKSGGTGAWREQEFRSEMQRSGPVSPEKRVISTDLPPVLTPGIPCERLIEQWKWNDFGDFIRRNIAGRREETEVKQVG